MHACMCVCRVQLGRMDFQVTQVKEESRWVRSNFTRVYKGSSVTAHTHTHTHTRICFLPTFFCDCRDSKGRRDLQDRWGLLDHRWAQQYGSVLLWNTSPALVIRVCICVINPFTYVLIRANQENLVQQGTAVTQGHQVYLESMVYLGLLGKKVERWVHTVNHALTLIVVISYEHMFLLCKVFCFF